MGTARSSSLNSDRTCFDPHVRPPPGKIAQPATSSPPTFPAQQCPASCKAVRQSDIPFADRAADSPSPPGPAAGAKESEKTPASVFKSVIVIAEHYRLTIGHRLPDGH